MTLSHYGSNDAMTSLDVYLTFSVSPHLNFLSLTLMGFAITAAHIVVLYNFGVH